MGIILTDDEGRPFERPRREDFADAVSYLRAVHVHNDAISACANRAFAVAFLASTRVDVTGLTKTRFAVLCAVAAGEPPVQAEGRRSGVVVRALAWLRANGLLRWRGESQTYRLTAKAARLFAARAIIDDMGDATNRGSR